MHAETYGGTPPGRSREQILGELAAVRRRTLELIAPLSEQALLMQHSPLMSPIVWDLCHIAEFEDLWLVRRLGEASGESELERTFDATRTPRAERGALGLPDRSEALDRLASVRSATTRKLGQVDVGASENPLLRDGFVYELVREHEAQHQETIVQTILLIEDEAYSPGADAVADAASPRVESTMLRVPAGPFEMGAGERRFAYDNERPRHTVHVADYEIGRFPVSNGEYLEFVASGGYADRRLWTDAGWEWKERAGLTCPRYWRIGESSAEPDTTDVSAEAARAGIGEWRRTTSVGTTGLRSNEPVMHVCLHEAQAYARFAEARLPSEAEWEKAAAWDPGHEVSRPYPWGWEPPTASRANLDVRSFGPSPLGSRPAGRSAVGCEHMLGDCWEWTASAFGPYPGFEAFPYKEYSAVFFGDEYVVLRGASWATDSGVARNTFRNWDYPIRRQILAGFRVARDVRGGA